MGRRNKHSVHFDIATLPTHFNGLSPRREHCAVVVAVAIDRSPVTYVAMDVPNRARQPRDNFTVRAGDAREAVRSLFIGGRPYAGITAGLAAVVHTHPTFDVIDPSQDDLTFAPPDMLGAVCHVGGPDIIWYDRQGPIDRPAGLYPARRWQLDITTSPLTTIESRHHAGHQLRHDDRLVDRSAS